MAGGGDDGADFLEHLCQTQVLGVVQTRESDSGLSGTHCQLDGGAHGSGPDFPVVLGRDRVMEVLRKLDVPSVEQVIAVPEISLDWVSQRSAARRPQTAEQLVDVPTERGYVFANIAAKALVWRGAAALAEQLVATPVPQGRRGGCGSLQDSRAGRCSSAAVVKQIVDIQVPHGRRGE